MPTIILFTFIPLPHPLVLPIFFHPILFTTCSQCEFCWFGGKWWVLQVSTSQLDEPCSMDDFPTWWTTGWSPVPGHSKYSETTFPMQQQFMVAAAVSPPLAAVAGAPVEMAAKGLFWLIEKGGLDFSTVWLDQKHLAKGSRQSKQNGTPAAPKEAVIFTTLAVIVHHSSWIGNEHSFVLVASPFLFKFPYSYP